MASLFKRRSILVLFGLFLSSLIAYFFYEFGQKKSYQLFYSAHVQSAAINARSTLDEALIIYYATEDKKTNCFVGRLIQQSLGDIDACRADSVCSFYMKENENKQKFSTLYDAAKKIEFDANICNKDVMTYTRSLSKEK